MAGENKFDDRGPRLLVGPATETPEGAALRRAYSDRGLAQVPRLLSLLDRNEFSKTYGCFNREYWLCRSVDFPSSIAQFGVHALALAYTQPFPDNPYLGRPKILLWTLAAIDYWTKIQKNDGSFDEFYPNERGWAGPTGFLVHAMCSSYRLLEGHVPAELDHRFKECVARAGAFLAKYDEPGVLANHHAMAILPIYEAYELLQDPKLLQGFHVRLDDFLSYCYEEGWCLEYDGADLGYLSATVSFLGKLRKFYTDERIEGVCRRAIEFCSYFTFPDGHYGGPMGSRQTLHFYPHGFELFAPENPTAGAVAETMLRALWKGQLVPPEIQEDRYFLYRIPELLQSWVDWKPREQPLPKLPWEREPFQKSWPNARMHARKSSRAYTTVNMAKGGTLQVCGLGKKATLVSDAGILALLDNGKVVTTQWIDADYEVRESGDAIEIEGPFHYMVMKAFTPWTMIGFRLFMLLTGWHTGMAYKIKGWIRKMLMTRSGKADARFVRTIRFEETGEVTVVDRIDRGGGPALVKVKIGDNFSVRYVPQSRYFQGFELSIKGSYLPRKELERLNREGSIEITRTFDPDRGLTGHGDGAAE